ncbi:sugar phosphate isomerase/epimerase family protein [Phyllobacterium endophyticum]|uniref:Sugar phosphate isomerase/epimerase n=1 Tax=Phyllobacterium endophyticum TaxID=1149773 RepID=A0A2P7AS19_9HYPH|nr:sugar phosphate isomerase/epimerase family protein [Phyllobacterium endophyticum]MBB3236733.1 sugar phosphate isomerase/epimerase [Phyllobacterium endophyticum]PSH57018.1 sugar phosphate isomerase/epimerase [Phyllobacterium endophyticum]TYR39704.1 sugar phosphate isomerase/epimerase [Phyllobacterium endophyticum]
MGTNANRLLLHSTVTKYSALAMDIEFANAAGFDGIEVTSNKLVNYLDAGYSEAELQGLLQNIQVPAIGFITDLERQGIDEVPLLKEAEQLFHLAKLVGAKGVQVLTGPINVQAVLDFKEKRSSRFYAGLLGTCEQEQIALTAKNLAKLADIAKNYDLLLYFEALAWTPLNTVAKQLAVLDSAERDNVKLVIDYWHYYASGDGPEAIAKLNKEVIFGVHICDSLPFEGGVPNEEVLRNVSTGKGVLDLREWTDAVKSTGYTGWWSCELFAKKDQQANSFRVAAQLKTLMDDLVLGVR